MTLLLGYLTGGRLQTLPLCWDTRGKRWFHLYPDEAVPAGDALHWTGPNQTWNYMCADCHSTGLRKNYDADRDVYQTTWSEIDVSCDFCGQHYKYDAVDAAQIFTSPGDRPPGTSTMH